MNALAAGIVCLTCFAGLMLAAAGLPGIWIMGLAGVLVKLLWLPDLLSWGAIASVLAMAAIGELIDLLASAVGAKRAGASGRAMVGAILGGIVGSVFGTVLIPIPLVGTILGGALGAGAFAAGMEMTVAERRLGDAARTGTGAFLGRLVATVAKTALAAIAAVVLSLSAVVEGI